MNDNVPLFEHPFLNVTVNAEGKENEVVAIMKATDADSGLNAELQYYLADSVENQFNIDLFTGKITRKVRMPCFIWKRGNDFLGKNSQVR